MQSRCRPLPALTPPWTKPASWQAFLICAQAPVAAVAGIARAAPSKVMALTTIRLVIDRALIVAIPISAWRRWRQRITTSPEPADACAGANSTHSVVKTPASRREFRSNEHQFFKLHKRSVMLDGEELAHLIIGEGRKSQATQHQLRLSRGLERGTRHASSPAACSSCNQHTQEAFSLRIHASRLGVDSLTPRVGGSLNGPHASRAPARAGAAPHPSMSLGDRAR